MPTVVNRKTNTLEVVGSTEWSWPDHPTGMSDAEARMRMPRAKAETGPRSEQARIDERSLAAKYGELLEAGHARVQQTTHGGDNLPRNVDGHLLSVRQELAADLVEHKAGWPPEVYDTER